MSAPVHRHRRRDLFHPFQTSSPSGRTSAHAGCAWTPSTWSSSCQPWNTASPTPTSKLVRFYSQHSIKFVDTDVIIVLFCPCTAPCSINTIVHAIIWRFAWQPCFRSAAFVYAPLFFPFPLRLFLKARYLYFAKFCKNFRQFLNFL